MIGDLEWKKREREWLIQDIHYYTEALMEWDDILKNENLTPTAIDQVNYFIQEDTERIRKRRKMLIQLREGTEVEDEWKRKVEKELS